ncbi:low-density lipoprotein receptor-related protein-like isoform X1 [Acanthaster planci]|uniref:Low-density lipoprotein receptor-related protein-like isoform X1 n=1 Tax=Acanthaster planci TaxID=133434 RepID=A0A8B7XHM6_ACAPL|nr:low-density lipoprotein receptor-related protein-like isoform X1 [Acanthaster planci]
MPKFKVKPAAQGDTLPFSANLGSSADNLSQFQVADPDGEKQSEKKRRLRTSPCEIISDFALNVSSAHGLPNIFRAKTKLGRLVWSLIFTGGIVLSIWQGALIFETYLRFQVTTEIKIITHNSLQFPSVTVCNTNKLRRSAIKSSKHRQMLVVDLVASLPYYAPCVGDDFLCRDRPVCVKSFLICDGIRQCGEQDTSDEEDCDYDFGSCAEEEFRCVYSGSRWGLCIPEEKRCNRRKDCYEGEDEDNCECKSSEFKCEKRGGCIPKTAVCNDVSDCLDESDEKNCTPDGTYQCSVTSFKCGRGDVCIPKAYLCDNHEDCPDGSDETQDICNQLSTTTEATPACYYGQFNCGDGQCISSGWMCDSYSDCANGMDESELYCGKTICDSGRVPCDLGGGCGVPCNLESDCFNSTDERNCECTTTNESGIDVIEHVLCSGISGKNYSNPFYYTYYLNCSNTGWVWSSFFTCIDGHITCHEPVSHRETPCKTVYTECYTNPNGQDYRGSIMDARCLPWTDDGVAALGYTGAAYQELEGVQPGSTVNHAFCRNPGGEGAGPWCFVVEGEPGFTRLTIHNCTVGPPSVTCSRDHIPPLSRRRRNVAPDPKPSSSVPGIYGSSSLQFQCLSGERIRAWQTCNGFPDCQDGSDEWSKDCGDVVSECAIDEFECREKTPEGTTKCIPKKYVCDDINHCSSDIGGPGLISSDEEACATPGDVPPANYFRCANGHKMVHIYDVCNTVPDCYPEEDDEYACTWKNGTDGRVQNPFRDPLWYEDYATLVKANHHYLFDEFSSRYGRSPFYRVKGEYPPDWNGFVTYSATPDYRDLVDVPKLSRDEVHRFGHQEVDFIIQCSYDENKCDNRDFKEFQDDTYGNCFTFNPNGTFIASKTGSRFGLRMTLFLEQSEYISIFGQEAGVRVAITPPNIRPNPTDNGFTVKPGAVTSIGLRYNFIKRQSDPYGKCQPSIESSFILENGHVRHIKPGEEYDRGLCKKTCVHTHIWRQCRCSDTLELDGQRCEILNTEQDLCKKLMYFLHQSENLTCDCPQQCDEVYYTKTSSTSAWPSANFMKHLLKNLHSLNKKTKHLNGNNINENIVRLEVFYEELNYESTKEIPAYESSSLLGDIGGIIGLYIGFSFITVAEFLCVIYKLVKNAFN